MRSNKLVFIALSSVLYISAGCSAFLDGKKAEPNVIEFSNEKLQCLSEMPQQIKRYSVGEASNEDTALAFDCMNLSLKYFTERTYGEKTDHYSTEEIRKFFGKYFLKENNVSPEFSVELMKIKQALLGGSETHVSKIEIGKLIEILTIAKTEAIALNPHIKMLLNQGTTKPVEVDAIVAGTTQIRQSFKILLKSTLLPQSNYSFEDAKRAFSGLADFLDGGADFVPYQTYSAWMPLIESVKNVLIGKQADISGLTQWSDSLDTLIDLFELALKYHYRLQDFKNLDRIKVRELGQFGNQIVQTINQSHQMKRHGLIPIADIDELLDQVSFRWELPFKIESLKKVYRVVILKILENNPSADPLKLEGLKRNHLRSLYREYSIWRLQQSFIDTLPPNRMDNGGMSQLEVLKSYRDFNKVNRIISLMMQDQSDQKAIELAWNDFGKTLEQPYALVLNEGTQLFIDHDSRNTKQSWKSLSYMNLMRTLGRLLFLGYANETRVVGKLNSEIPAGSLIPHAYLPEGSLVTWYDDFYDLGVDLKAFDTRSGNAGERSFLEANFFTYHGNGDNQLNYLETVHFISTLFTAGLSSSGRLSDGMAKANCGVGSLDHFGKPNFDKSCFKNELRKNIAVYFPNVPGLVRYVKSLDDKNWDLFFNHLDIATEQKFVAKNIIETANIRTIVTILHYIENLFIVFDKDASQTLSLNEVYGATPRFMEFFKKVSGTSIELLLREGFAYLVFEGDKIPGLVDITKFQFKKHKYPDAQRMEILRLFGTLKDELNSPKK